MSPGRMACILLLSLAACSSTKDSGKDPSPPAHAAPRAPAIVASDEQVVAACRAHLALVQRLRLARDLGPDFARLAGPAPEPADIQSSMDGVRAIGIDAAPADLLSAGSFATAAQPLVQKAGYTFLAWTANLEDVGLAKVQGTRPGAFHELASRPMAYEVMLLDGFLVPDYPTYEEATLAHAGGAREDPRVRGVRGRILIIDQVAIARDRERALADKRPEKAYLREALRAASPDDLLREVELREAGYLRFQNDVKDPAALDRLVTWLEVAEGDPDLALSDVVCSGDRGDERRRVRVLDKIMLDINKAQRGLLDLPSRTDRDRALKELAREILKNEAGE